MALSQATDADLLDRETVAMNTLRATTVDLATLDTANNTQKSLFIQIQGLVPHGFQVNSVRIKNDGELNLGVKVTTTSQAGAPELCGALHLRVLKNWQSVYDASLENFVYETSVDSQQAEDLVFAVGLGTSDASLASKNCTFNFLVESTQEVGGGSIRFKDSETLQNQVATSFWQ